MFFFRWFFKRKKKSQQLLEIPAIKKSWNLKSLFTSSGIENQTAILSAVEETLITSDVSIKTTMDILAQLQKNMGNHTKDESITLLGHYISNIVLDESLILDENKLNIIFVFGVNGVGKTTSVAKLSYYLKQQGEDIVLAAADTYRAAAVDQLKTWATIIDVPLIYHEGKSKPAAVVYDAMDSAIARKRTVLIIDTAGRFHNRNDLLAELEKLQRIIKEKAPDAKVQNLLVLDSTTGQNALEQAKHFHDAVGISGIILSKWDSSGKGGIVLTLSAELSLPVYLVGVGEGLNDMRVFHKEEFINHLLN